MKPLVSYRVLNKVPIGNSEPKFVESGSHIKTSLLTSAVLQRGI